MENNLISLDGNSNNKLFEIGFDTVKNKLTFKSQDKVLEQESDSSADGSNGVEPMNNLKVEMGGFATTR